MSDSEVGIRRSVFGGRKRGEGITNNSGRGSWVLMFGLLVVVFNLGLVSALNVDGYNVSYNAGNEQDGTIPYEFNFSKNVTLDADETLSNYSIDDSDANKIYLDSEMLSQEEISSWISINSSTGILSINSTHNNQTGLLQLPLTVTVLKDAGGSTTDRNPYNFTITPVNDPPTFTELTDGEAYNFSENSENLIIQYNATDEEGEYDGTGYPLNFSSNITWCNSSINTTDCNNLFDLSLVGNNSMKLNINRANDYVGHYNITFWVNDSENQTEINVTFEIVNVNDAPNITFACDNNRNMTENDIMSCWINATDVDENSNLTFAIFSNSAKFVFNDSTTSYLYNCSGGGDCDASANVTFVLDDYTVGNWSVNISVTDTGAINTIDWVNFSFFVNNTEDNVSIVEKDDFPEFSGSEHEFEVTAYDDDLLVNFTQTATKKEALTFISNDSDLVYFGIQSSPDGNKSVIVAHINWEEAMRRAEGVNITYASINISVTDTLGISGPEIYSSDETIFTITFDNSNADPNWTESATYNFSIQEDNSTWGGVNLSEGYVTDADEENITFYYTNDTQFDNFNLSNSSGSWIINFTPEDVDVGYHNITMIASDGNVNVTHQFNFTVTNIADKPEIHSLSANNGTVIPKVGGDFNLKIAESSAVTFELVIDDDDFLIPDNQSKIYGFYNESLTITVTATNLSEGIEDLFNFSFVEFENPKLESALYNATFTPNSNQIGNYTIFVNITDNSSNSVNRTFYLNISAVNDAPNLTLIENQSKMFNEIFDLDINATDDEEGNDSSGNLTYYLNFTIGDDFTIGNESIFNTTSGIFNLTLNLSYVGEYHINVTVSDGEENDSQVFYLYVYGAPNITSPSEGYQFNWTENNATGDLEFEVEGAINNTNLTYVFYLDNIVYSNSTAFNYTNLTIMSLDNLRNSTNWTWVQESNYSWNFTPSYSDETYGMLKNLTLLVYNSEYPELNDSVNWKVNISHLNQNVSWIGEDIPNVHTIYKDTTTITINLSKYFRDVDYWDKNVGQVVNFTIKSVSATDNVAAGSSVNADWILTLHSTAVINETIYIIAYEWNDSNMSIGNATSNNITVNVIEPPTTVTPTPTPSSGGGGGGRTKLKHFSLKLVVPQDIIISDKNYIEIPFTIQNNGQMDLKGINLSSFVKFNDIFTDDVKISLGDNYIDMLKFGQSEDFTMIITANTQRAGKYKATIFADVESPKFSDWGDFIIEVRKANESEAEQILIFTEKIISENPECLELTELLHRANAAFAKGDYSDAMNLGQEAIVACEDAIKVNEQIRYKIEGAVKDNFYYISFVTLAIFFLGFIFYVYKRVRFNKYKTDEYI